MFLDNAASTDITTRPYELDYASSASVGFARSCIESCQHNHKECRRSAAETRQGPETIDPNSLPSRLLQLIKKGSELQVKLIGQGSPEAIQREEVSQQGFAILSYCWGGPQPVHLTQKRVAEFGAGTPISQLPTTLRDAAWYTHEIGLEYLWIDALCIIQDDVEDKLRETSRVELYYSQSTVTLCAASAAKCSDGFLTSRGEDSTNHGIGPIQLQAKTSSDASGSIQALAESEDLDPKRPQEPITLRGWTLQEVLISRRILIFSSRHLKFTCAVTNACCTGPEPMLKPRVATSFESQVVGVDILSDLGDCPARNVWDTIVIEYTRRQLGLPADKLPAVSAIASSLIRMAKERDQKLLYLAGLMVDTSDPDHYAWRAQLLWVVSQTEDTHHVPGRAPSWTWSSVDGPVRTWDWPKPNDWSSNDGIRLHEYRVEPEDEVAPFGAVKGGYLKITARTRGLGMMTDFNYAVSTNRDSPNRSVEAGKSLLILSPDTKDREQVVNWGFEMEQDVFLLELIPFYENRTSPAGIIVTQMPNTGHYVRVGRFEFQKPEGEQTAEEMAARQKMFDDCPFEEIQIV